MASGDWKQNIQQTVYYWFVWTDCVVVVVVVVAGDV